MVTRTRRDHQENRQILYNFTRWPASVTTIEVGELPHRSGNFQGATYRRKRLTETPKEGHSLADGATTVYNSRAVGVPNVATTEEPFINLHLCTLWEKRVH
jgi:hypothetical protein